MNVPDPRQRPIEAVSAEPSSPEPSFDEPLAPEHLQLEHLQIEPPLAAAPLAVIPPSNPEIAEAAPGTSPFLSQLLAELLRRIAAFDRDSLKELVPVLQLLALAVAAGLVLRITGATLHAIDELPLMGGLLELVGLVGLLSFLSRNALRQRKRAELLAWIRKLRRDLLG